MELKNNEPGRGLIIATNLLKLSLFSVIVNRHFMSLLHHIRMCMTTVYKIRTRERVWCLQCRSVVERQLKALPKSHS